MTGDTGGLHDAGTPTRAEGTPPSPSVPPEVVGDLMALLSAPVVPHPDARVEQLRRVSRRAYLSWTEQEDAVLLALSDAGFGVADLSSTLCRQPGAIQSRLLRLVEGPKAVGQDREQQAARRQDRQRRRQERQQRRERAAGPPPTRVPRELVVPHFEAWLALVRTGATVEILEGDQVVAVLRAPAGEPRGQRPATT